MDEGRRLQLGGNPNPRVMQRRIAASEEVGTYALQGSSLPGLVGGKGRFAVGPSGLPLVRCPRCGSAVVECRSWKQGGRVFFKCEDNEQFVSI